MYTYSGFQMSQLNSLYKIHQRTNRCENLATVDLVISILTTLTLDCLLVRNDPIEIYVCISYLLIDSLIPDHIKRCSTSTETMAMSLSLCSPISMIYFVLNA